MKLTPLLAVLLMFGPLGAAPAKAKKAAVKVVQPRTVVPKPVIAAQERAHLDSPKQEQIAEWCKEESPYWVYSQLLHSAQLWLYIKQDTGQATLIQDYIDVLKDWGRGLKVE